MNQLFFDFYSSSQNNDFTSENFVFFAENQLAHNLLQKFFSIKNFDDNPFKIVAIEGDSCCGKTHLVKTFGLEHNFNFINSEQIAKQDPYDLFCHNNFFAIDDLNSLKNDERLLQIINCAQESKSMLVLIFRNLEMFQLADLKSRLKNFNSAKINQTNPHNLKLIFTNILSRKQIFLSQQIIDYILAHIIPKYSEIVYCAKAIEFYSHKNDKKFSINTIDKILKQNFYRFDQL